MSKFKIGEEIFYMETNIPKKSIIKGISRYEGDCEVLTGSTRRVKEGDQLFVYHLGGYSVIEEKDAYASKEELISMISSKL